MEKKALIFDLDNTIYPVASIAPILFPPLYRLLEEHGIRDEELAAIKQQVMRIPFHKVAALHGLSKDLENAATQLLSEMSYEGEIHFFSDYPLIREIPGTRFLVTMGFPRLQWSKIRGMDIEQDFREIHVVDPEKTHKTKKDIFSEILEKHQYSPTEVLVIGDDPESEIKAAGELGIDAVLYDKDNRYEKGITKYQISNYQELKELLTTNH